MTLDFSRSRLTPFAHQREDTIALTQNPFYFITSEMRTGKTKIVIDATQFMFEAEVINRVIVVCPAPVRGVWSDQQIGEIAKHSWLDIPATVTEYHAKLRVWHHQPQIEDPSEQEPKRALHNLATSHRLEWIVTNFEFLRSKNRLNQLLPFAGPKTLLVIDESSFIKGHDSQQTKACLQLRRACGRVVLLNGTPISHSPKDLFSQGNILHPSILDCSGITKFNAKYAITQPVIGSGGKPVTSPRGYGIQQIVGWRPEGIVDLQRRFAPYTVRRLQKECLDLPPKLDAVTLTATLEPATWKQYKAMRDDLVVWLKSGNVSVASQAATKVLRLSQITSGFLGGVEGAGIEDVESFNLEGLILPGMTPGALEIAPQAVATQRIEDTQEIGREKLDVVLWFLKQRLEVDPTLHIIVWCRFRAEMFRLLAEVQRTFPQFLTGYIAGQKQSLRKEAMELLHPSTSPKDVPVFVTGIYGTGAFGLNFTAAHTSVNCSFDYSLGKFLQSGDRIYGPGQEHPCAYFDVVATGPDGQKTIDHTIVAARRNNEDIANWTQSAWIKALTQE